MLNVLKKVEGLRHGTGGAKGAGLEPPKNLPDLARDIYEREQIVSSSNTSTPVNTSSSGNSATTSATSSSRLPNATDMYSAAKISQFSQNISNDNRMVAEPNKDSVPKLDLSLVKQHIAASQAAVQSIPPTPVQHSAPIVQSYPVQNTYTNGVSSNIAPNISIPVGEFDDSYGFFKEFEEYVRNNGVDNDVVNDLLDRNWLDHMHFYHTSKSEDMPFYTSSAELSHAIRLKLEDLQNLERNWIVNKQKLDLLQKFNSTIDAEIHLKSEELKRLILDSKKHVSVNTLSNHSVTINDNIANASKPADFFHILKPKSSEHLEQNSAQAQPSIVSSVTPSFSIPQYPSTSSTSKYLIDKYALHDSSKYFYACNGQVFKSLADFINGLESMDIDTFNYHVSDTKNDFSNWIKGVFGDYRLSDAIRHLTSREKLWHYLRNALN